MLCAVMTIIPYIGIIVSALLPISVAWITTGSIWYPLAVIAIFSIVQYLEANVIFPKVVGTQLNLSTWATLVAIVAGGIMWGVLRNDIVYPFCSYPENCYGQIRRMESIKPVIEQEIRLIIPVGLSLPGYHKFPMRDGEILCLSNPLPLTKEVLFLLFHPLWRLPVSPSVYEI